MPSSFSTMISLVATWLAWRATIAAERRTDRAAAPRTSASISACPRIWITRPCPSTRAAALGVARRDSVTPDLPCRPGFK